MSWLQRLGLVVAFVMPVLPISHARADGCYLCGPGSTGSCQQYCRYRGQDSFDARKQCERKGCRVTGTASCPSAGTVCSAPSTPSKDSLALQSLPRSQPLFCAIRPS